MIRFDVPLRSSVNSPDFTETIMEYSVEKADEIYAVAKEAYRYAYPIVSMDATMRQVTNVPDANSLPPTVDSEWRIVPSVLVTL